MRPRGRSGKLIWPLQHRKQASISTLATMNRSALLLTSTSAVRSSASRSSTRAILRGRSRTIMASRSPRPGSCGVRRLHGIRQERTRCSVTLRRQRYRSSAFTLKACWRDRRRLRRSVVRGWRCARVAVGGQYARPMRVTVLGCSRRFSSIRGVRVPGLRGRPSSSGIGSTRVFLVLRIRERR